MRRHPDRIRKRAIEYTEHGWPVTGLAVPEYASRTGRTGPDQPCPCGQPASACLDPHRVGPTIDDPDTARHYWTEHPGLDIALVTSRFDVIDLPANYGAMLNQKLVTTIPTATAPRGRRWHFVFATGSVPVELVTAAEGILHTGPDEWIAASPTWTEATGRIGWVVPPVMTGWNPYQRNDLVSLVFSNLNTPNPGLPATVTDITDGKD